MCVTDTHMHTYKMGKGIGDWDKDEEAVILTVYPSTVPEYPPCV